MLREIRPEDVAEYERDDIVILYREAIWTPDELAEELGLRFLVDDEPEEEPEQEDEAMEEVKTRRSTEEIRELIREAVEAGCTRRSEIMDYCDITGMTADRHKDLWKQPEE